MFFTEQIHWYDGQFIQPHHFQQLQYRTEHTFFQHLSMLCPYPCGFLDWEPDEDALAGGMLSFRRLSAIMPDGTAISIPGNASLETLDISKVEIPPEGLLVYLALPEYSLYERNLGTSASENYSYILKESTVRDENSGGNAIPLLFRRPNVRLVTGETKGMRLLPVVRLQRVVQKVNGAVPVIDSEFIPPFFRITSDSPLYRRITDFVYELNLRKNKLENDLMLSDIHPESFSGISQFNILQLRSINRALPRFRAMLTPFSCSPYDVYVELCSLFEELHALNVQRIFDETQSYNHLDSAFVFKELFNGIRALILVESGLGFQKFEFKENEKGLLAVSLHAEQMVNAEEYYLAQSCAMETHELIYALEHGDFFRLVNPGALKERIRGMKLQELRIPPRCLPSLPNTLWFLLKRSDSPKLWNDICTENTLVIDYAKESFPQLEATLYMTVRENGGNS